MEWISAIMRIILFACIDFELNLLQFWEANVVGCHGKLCKNAQSQSKQIKNKQKVAVCLGYPSPK